LVNSYILKNTHQASIVGISFDYLIRFEIAKTVNCDKQSVYKNIVAKKGLKKLESYTDRKTFRALKKEYNKCIKIIMKHVLGSVSVYKNVITSACFLGTLD